MNIKVKAFKRCEIVLHGIKEYANPVLDVDIDATFTHEDGTVVAIPGFWNGGNEWKVRFAHQKTGVWKYSVVCSDKENAGLFDEGTVEVEYAEPQNELQQHGYVTIEKGKRYLSYSDGTPFLWIGDTHWQMPDYEHTEECNFPGCTCGSQFKHLADDRIKKKFTVYQTYFDSALTDGGGNKRVHLWWSEKYTQLNPAAFNESADVMFDYLADNGITIALGFGVHANTVNSFGKIEPLLTFAKYCVARYACYPIVWITAQEITFGADVFNKYIKVMELVDKYDGFRRPHSAHMVPVEGTNDYCKQLNALPYHTHWTLQAGHGGLDKLKSRFFYKSFYDIENIKPFIETECHYDDLFSGGFDAIQMNGHDASRVGAYLAMQSGSAGFTYGVTGIWGMRWSKSDAAWSSYNSEPWYAGMQKHGSTEMTYLRNFYTYIGWEKLTPRFGMDCGYFEMRRNVAVSGIGDDILAYYFYDGTVITGTLTGLKPNARYQARWYDTLTDKFIALPDVITENGTYVAPNKPSKRDWMLLLNCVDLGEYPEEIYPPRVNPIPASAATPGDEIKISKLYVSSFEDGFEDSHLTDGNPETSWRPFAAGTSQVIVADLGEVQDVGYIEMVTELNAPQFVDYIMCHSTDGENWYLTKERTNNSILIGGKFDDYYEPIEKKCRFIKLLFNVPAIGVPKLQLKKLTFYK